MLTHHSEGGVTKEALNGAPDTALSKRQNSANHHSEDGVTKKVLNGALYRCSTFFEAKLSLVPFLLFFPLIVVIYSVKGHIYLKTKESQPLFSFVFFCLFYFNPATSYIWEHRSGNIPISFFGVPFKVASSEVWHCMHGSVRVT